MEAKLRFFSELYNILSVKSCCKPFKRLFNRSAHGIYYYRMLYRATIDRQKNLFREFATSIMVLPLTNWNQ